MPEVYTLFKLILLYLLNEIDSSLTNVQISNFFLDLEYTSYFTVQSVLSELTEAKLIHAEIIQNISYYTITPEGEETLNLFKAKIPLPIRKDIKDYLRKNKIQLREEVSVLSDYYRNTSGEFSVRCRVKEKQADLIDLSVTVPDEAQAKAVCRHWQKKCQSIYAYVMKELL